MELIALFDIKTTTTNNEELAGALRINYFLASGDFCRLLIAFSNSLDTDQNQTNVGTDLDPNHLTLL